MRKLKTKDEKWHIQGHGTSNWQSLGFSWTTLCFSHFILRLQPSFGSHSSKTLVAKRTTLYLIRRQNLQRQLHLLKKSSCILKAEPPFILLIINICWCSVYIIRNLSVWIKQGNLFSIITEINCLALNFKTFWQLLE